MKKKETTRMEAVHPSGRLNPLRGPAILLALTLLGLFASTAEAIPLSASGPPTLTGSGADTTARWSNVGTLDGQSIDLFMEIIAHTGQDTYAITTENDDFKFQFTDGNVGDVRSATLRWTFYEAGTTTPVTISDLAFTVDDLDDDERHESLSTADAYDYLVNNPSTLAHNMTGGTVTAAGAGGIEYNSGDPEAAVKLLFSDKSSLVITYQTEFGDEELSAYHHDGDGDFAFDDPPVNVYYTFDLTNHDDAAQPVSFSDSLPAGMVWDTEYSEVTGTITGDPLVFSNGNRDVSVATMLLHPGANSLKLRTLETSQSGIVYNEATIDPHHPQLDPMIRSATVVLP